MKTVNEQITEMQKKTMESLEPMKNMNTVAAVAFEKIARKNYDLMGDLVDYAVAQAKMPEGDIDVTQIYEQRMAETKAFADKVSARAAEYVELAGELGEMVGATTKAAMPSIPGGDAEAKSAPAKKKSSAKKSAPAKKKSSAKKSAAKTK